jgi:DNA polymerase III alpha subunit
MFITLEDETGIANLVVWPQVFEKFRRTVMAASMMAVRGRIQREGEVVHLVAHQLTDLSSELASVGSRDAAFPLPHGRGDQVTNAGAGPDPRDRPPKGLRTRDIYIRLCRTRHKRIYPEPETMPSGMPKARDFR